MAGNAGDRSLKETPTWAVALVCAVMVIISVAMEHGLHSLGKWFQKRQKKAMNEALEKIKAELMLLGFISLLLTFGQAPISKICIPAGIGDIMLPCQKISSASTADDDQSRRKLLQHDDEPYRRFLAGTTSDQCSKHEGWVPLISQSGIHQLHIFIFVLAVFMFLYSVITVVLGKAKMKKWKAWETETTSLEYQFSNDPSRFRLTHQTSFVKRHLGLSSTPGIRWIVAFFRQFYGSVTKVDYLTMRHGFINAHLSQNSKFNFHKYIKRSLEDDFKVVVGISPPLWFLAIIILLLDVYGFYTLVWIAFVPLIVLLLVGMKLEIVIMEMAHHIQERTSVIKGAPIVEPSNHYFWFNRPQWILFLIHLTLFENAFQLAHFLWTWYTFGLRTCLHDNLTLTLFLCSYMIFPLYALVTQMGSHMKKAIFEEQTAKALQKWRQAARERKKQRDANSGDNTPSRGSSPLHLLHKYRTSSSPDVESVRSSPMHYYHSDNEIFHAEPEPKRPPRSTNIDDGFTDDFTFFSP
ncbi:hypothetical protein J5N97_016488 [Dioscorea zingiberensis]|uniref:MLO-like protein n=1 Tax=Dioscorea zingiberensis TaxID=325984 RepID=A0A9D5HFP3_9LILI|nr:hypothetical protein J5N97_016488 [Dioscorea zingiberensis]